MVKVSNSSDFKIWIKTINTRSFSKTRKVRKTEDLILFESIHEKEVIAKMISVRSLPILLEKKLIDLNKAFQKEQDPVIRKILLLEYDIIVESTGDLDKEDIKILRILQEKLNNLVNKACFPLERLEHLEYLKHLIRIL